METIITSVIVAAVSFAGSWGGVKVHLMYLQHSIEDHEARLRIIEKRA